MNNDSNDVCFNKVISHLRRLDRIPIDIDTSIFTREEITERKMLAETGLRMLCDMGEGEKFCKYIDKVAEKEKELGRRLTLLEYFSIVEDKI